MIKHKLQQGMPDFTGIRHTGIIHKSIFIARGYESVKIEAFKWIKTMRGNVKRSLHRPLLLNMLKARTQVSD